jgi:hypothetical protein
MPLTVSTTIRYLMVADWLRRSPISGISRVIEYVTDGNPGFTIE